MDTILSVALVETLRVVVHAFRLLRPSLFVESQLFREVAPLLGLRGILPAVFLAEVPGGFFAAFVGSHCRGLFPQGNPPGSVFLGLETLPVAVAPPQIEDHEGVGSAVVVARLVQSGRLGVGAVLFELCRAFVDSRRVSRDRCAKVNPFEAQLGVWRTILLLLLLLLFLCLLLFLFLLLCLLLRLLRPPTPHHAGSGPDASPQDRKGIQVVLAGGRGVEPGRFAGILLDATKTAPEKQSVRVLRLGAPLQRQGAKEGPSFRIRNTCGQGGLSFRPERRHWQWQ